MRSKRSSRPVTVSAFQYSWPNANAGCQGSPEDRVWLQGAKRSTHSARANPSMRRGELYLQVLPTKKTARETGGGKGNRQTTAAQKAGGMAVGCERRHVVKYEKQAVV